MKYNHPANNKVISRRKFVKQTALASGALMLPAPLPFPLFGAECSKQFTGIHEQQILSEGWKIASIESETIDNAFLSNTETEWFSVPSMPAMPHKILLHHKKIEEPWKPFGMEKCYWVSEKGWVYSTQFSVENTEGEQRLVFKELKGKVTVYLNGEKLSVYGDQAHPLLLDVSGILKNENQLALHFDKAAPDVKSSDPDLSKRKKNGTYLGPNPQLFTCF